MHSESLVLSAQGGRASGLSSVLGGGSVLIVAGFAFDLLRLGAHSARQAFSAHAKRRQAAPCTRRRDGHTHCFE